MKEEERIDPAIAACPIYEPGRPIETVARELGLNPSEIIKLASNENPYGPSPRSVAAIQKVLGSLNDYPDGGCYAFRQRVAQRHELEPEQILPGNGSNEILEMIATAYLRPGESALFGEYGFIVYKLATLHAKATPIATPMPNLAHDLNAMRDAVRADTKVVFLASPNNPSGSTVPTEELYQFVDSLPETVLFCMDEAYAEYLESPPDFCSRIAKGQRILCVRTFSKIFGLAGLRVGYAYGSREIIQTLNRVRQPFNVSIPGQVGAIAGLDDTEHIEKSRALNQKEMQRMVTALQGLQVVVRPTDANFVLIQVPSSDECFRSLLNEGVIIRSLTPYGLRDWIRVTVGTASQVDRFVTVFERWWAAQKDKVDP